MNLSLADSQTRNTKYFDFCSIHGVRLALGLFVTQNPEWPSFLGPSLGRNGPFWEVREIEISMREPDFEPFSFFGPSIFGVKKVKV